MNAEILFKKIIKVDHNPENWDQILLFAGINFLFVIKYGIRTGSLFPLILIIYSLVFLYALLLVPSLAPEKIIGNRLSPLAITVSFSLFAAALLFFVHPESVRVDRWNAITSFWSAAFRGEYPYSVLTPLGTPISGLPGLMVIALPFYCIGDAGIMNLFALPLFAYSITSLNIGKIKKQVILLLLCSSPAFLWEITVRSELFANMVLVLITVVAAEKFRNSQSIRAMVLLGCAAGFISCTRTICIIIYFVYFMRYLGAKGFRFAAVFAAAYAIGFFTPLAPFFIGHQREFMAFSPFAVQGIHISKFLMIPVAAATIFAAWKTSNIGQFFCNAAYLITGIVLSAFLTVAEYNYIDISYFIFALPFALAGAYVLQSTNHLNPWSFQCNAICMSRRP